MTKMERIIYDYFLESVYKSPELSRRKCAEELSAILTEYLLMEIKKILKLEGENNGQ